MQVGVFGKIPSRRDYVRHGVGPRLMRLIDPWLQHAVAESRATLGEAWLASYLVAPIWRFWLGPDLAGGAVLGALMPSVDGIGRYFPLCALAASDAPIAPPVRDDQAGWFEAVEALLLEALAEGGSYEALLEGLGQLPPPHIGGATAAESPVCEAFAALGAGDAIARDLSCWWVAVADGAGAPVTAMVRRGLPPPAEYASMLAPDQGPAAALGGSG